MATQLGHLATPGVDDLFMQGKMGLELIACMLAPAKVKIHESCACAQFICRPTIKIRKNIETLLTMYSALLNF